jgi:hypothetical protein
MGSELRDIRHQTTDHRPRTTDHRPRAVVHRPSSIVHRLRSEVWGLRSGLRDRIFIVNTILFILVGVVILYRSTAIGLTPLALIIGGGFIAFGVYRLRWIWRYFQRGR